MTPDWQTWTALGIVLCTALIMAWRLLVKKKTGCGSDCGCTHLKVTSKSVKR